MSTHRSHTPGDIHPHEVLSARAFAPGHITGFFEIDDSDPDPLRRGSRGAGLSLAAGVVTDVSISLSTEPSLTIALNGATESEAPVSRRVVKLFSAATGDAVRAVRIEHFVSVPQGAGFGSSGAGALSLALAVNAACGRPMGEVEAARLAHRAEIDCRTGLGTVLACTAGGLEIRTRAGAPGVGEGRSFPVPGGLIVLCFVYGPLSTAASLADPAVRRKITEAGARLGRRLLDEPTVPRFIELSREFTEAAGLVTPRLRGFFESLDRRGVAAAMTHFGEAIFTVIEAGRRSSLDDLVDAARADGAVPFESRISAEGASVMDDDGINNEGMEGTDVHET
ncbi:MAG: GHMP kinase [Spirochaetales bacterium]|nr:GHMP kinase [Spirochaetales bacterium]